MRTLAILGSTGSIGTSTLDVVRAHPERLVVVALAAGRNRDLLKAQCEAFRPRCVSVGTKEDADWLRASLSYQPELHWGAEGLLACALHAAANTVVAAIVGSAGLASTEAALRAGRRVCVANKESLVVGGALMHEAALAGGGELLPVDSEHAALHQLLSDRDPATIREVRITASGGPFRDWPLARIQAATIEQALNHPTWKMGKRITIDSATLMNKGFEVIEACRLFHVPPSQVQVIVHPQSTIHSMVEFVDGSILAQFSVTDMRLPILYALTYPERVSSDLRFPVMNLRHLDFCPPDMAKFPCLRLAYEAAEAGGAKTIALNAADEVAVAAFLGERIGFEEIPRIIEDVMAATPTGNLESIHQVLALDAGARQVAEEMVKRSNRPASPVRAIP